mmetsp:Transcript_57281/g.166195  ORF Transcript_57281/g.166195 Transcript_57281/m.166195 type:complete len:311 (-) Transcript_57281:118-1050(-)
MLFGGRRLALATSFLALFDLSRGERHRLSHPPVALDEAPPRRRSLAASLGLLLLGGQGVGAQEKHVSQEFRALDMDSDGRVSQEEYMNAARVSLLASSVSRGDDYIEQGIRTHARRFAEADLDGDGILYYHEVEYMGFLANQEILKSMNVKEAQSDAEFHASFDTNQDGKVSAAEFVSGIAGPTYIDDNTQEWLQVIAARADLDDDGTLDEQELLFASYLVHKTIDASREIEAKILAMIFGGWDLNGDRLLDEREVAQAMEADAKSSAALQGVASSARSGFAELDRNGDGRWDEDEARTFAAAFAKRILL